MYSFNLYYLSIIRLIVDKRIRGDERLVFNYRNTSGFMRFTSLITWKKWARKYNTTTINDNCFVKIKRMIPVHVVYRYRTTVFLWTSIFWIFTSRNFQHPEIFCAVVSRAYNIKKIVRWLNVGNYTTLKVILLFCSI